MSDATPHAPVPSAAPITALPRRDRADGLTPAGLQAAATLRRRRLLMAALNLLTLAALTFGIARVFGAGGWTAPEMVVFACFLIGAPWTVMGFWNAVVGLWVLHGGRMAQACPVLDSGLGDAPVTLRVALTMFLRNEDPQRPLSRLAAMVADLNASGQGGAFSVYVLSDSDDPAVQAAEARVFADLRPVLGPRAEYRLRADNAGWKAGNIRDFLRRWGGDCDAFLPLDSDSLMSASAILRLTRTLQAHPRLGIVQALCLGAPSDSLFARLFQFGMRHGMRSFTAGAVWWHGDAGAYWGHNAIIRTAPFKTRCRLPVLPGRPPLGGHVLSHDQVEAALMRRAGYEVRVLPVELESFEDNPPTIMDFIKRDHRWCNGNMQYLKLLDMPGLVALSRFQIVSAIAMYFGGPAWMLMTLAAASMMLMPQAASIDAAFGVAMFFIMFSMSLAPKIAGWVDVALTRGGVARYGGGLRFAAGAAAETAFSMLMAPVTAFAVTVFMVALAFGRTIKWSGQQRDLTRVTWAQGARAFWPQTLLGVALAALIGALAPGALPWAAPVLAGLTLAIPFAVLTASPRLGAWARRVGLCATPEELAPPPILTAVAPAPRPARAA